MPAIKLKVIEGRPDGTVGQPSETAGPLFRGNGDIDYVCGHCGFVIAAGLSATQHVMVERTACAACGAVNEFPPELRS